MQNSKVILVTGSSRGIGETIANHLKNKNNIVYGSSRSIPDKADKRHIQLDVTDISSCKHALEKILAEHGRLNVLINNAGYHLTGAVQENTLEEMHAQMAVNFYGVANMVNAALPLFLEQKAGKIINTSSIGGLLSLPFTSAYNASKYALEGYAEALRLELLPLGIYVSNIEPGYVNSGTMDQSIIKPKKSIEPFANYRILMEDQMNKQAPKGTSKQAIAEIVEKIILSEKPKFRYKIGSATKILPLLKAIMPQNTFESMVLKSFDLPKRIDY